MVFFASFYLDLQSQHIPVSDFCLHLVQALMIPITRALPINLVGSLMKKYILKIENVLDWLTIVGVSIAVFPALFQTRADIILNQWYWQISIGSYMIAFYRFIIKLRLIPMFGSYITIFIQILKDLYGVIGLLVILWIMFCSGFHFSFIQRQDSFSTWHESLIKVLAMIIGEYDYDDLFYPDQDSAEDAVYNSYFEFSFYVVFVFVMTITAVNTVTGLTFDDVKKFRAISERQKLIIQHEYMEAVNQYVISAVVIRIG